MSVFGHSIQCFLDTFNIGLIDRSSLGKWIDDSCIRKALVVCQKKQIITFGILKQAIDNLTDTIGDQNSVIASQAKEIVYLKGKAIYMTDTVARQYQVIAEQRDELESLRSNLSQLMDKASLMSPVGQTNATLSNTINTLDKLIVTQANEIQHMKKGLQVVMRVV